MSTHRQDGLNINPSAQPVNVPSFTCVVYVSKTDNGQVRARVANLAGIEFAAATERDVLTKIVPAFKQQVSRALEQNESVSWIDPPLPMNPDESERLLPVHL